MCLHVVQVRGNAETPNVSTEQDTSDASHVESNKSPVKYSTNMILGLAAAQLCQQPSLDLCQALEPDLLAVARRQAYSNCQTDPLNSSYGLHHITAPPQATIASTPEQAASTLDDCDSTAVPALPQQHASMGMAASPTENSASASHLDKGKAVLQLHGTMPLLPGHGSVRGHSSVPAPSQSSKPAAGRQSQVPEAVSCTVKDIVLSEPGRFVDGRGYATTFYRTVCVTDTLPATLLLCCLMST